MKLFKNFRVDDLINMFLSSTISTSCITIISTTTVIKSSNWNLLLYLLIVFASIIFVHRSFLVRYKSRNRIIDRFISVFILIFLSSSIFVIYSFLNNRLHEVAGVLNSFIIFGIIYVFLELLASLINKILYLFNIKYW